MSRVEFYRHQLGDEEAAEWRKVLDTLFLTLGPQVAAFEKELGEFLVRRRAGATPPHVVGTNSCSMGMLIALRALDVGPGDEVITTPMTFAATSNAILHLARSRCWSRSSARRGSSILRRCVRRSDRGRKDPAGSLYGQLADMKALRSIADAHSLFIVEDSAHGIEMERDGVRPGDLSEAARSRSTRRRTSRARRRCGRDARSEDRRTSPPPAKPRRLEGGDRAPRRFVSALDLVELGYKAN